MKKILYLLFISMLFLHTRCDDEDNEYQLPPASQKGANTIGCKVNDIVCIPKSSFFLPEKTKYLCYNEQTGELRLRFYFEADDDDYKNGIPYMSVRIGADSIFNIGSLEHDQFAGSFDIAQQYQASEEYYYSSDLPNLTIVFKITKLDKINKIISGTFNFQSYLHVGLGEYDTTKKAEITEGRFDLKYNVDGSCVEGYSNQ